MASVLAATVAEMEGRNREWEATTKAGGYWVAELREAFEAVEDKEHWKNPIRASVHHSRVAVTGAAVMYFHGSKVSIEGTTPDGEHVILSGPGYVC